MTAEDSLLQWVLVSRNNNRHAAVCTADMFVHHPAGTTQTCAVSLLVEFDHAPILHLFVAKLKLMLMCIDPT